MTSNVLLHQRDGWAEVTLNRPERKNAMTGPMMDELAQAIDQLSADESVAAVVLRGADGAFSSGVDLTELQAGHDWVPNFQTSLRSAHVSLFRCACPIVVALERYAINGSTALALAGDLVVAGENAFMQIGEIRQGAHAPMNMAWLALKSSESVMSRMAYIGDRVGAEELSALGLVHEVVASDDVVARAQAIAAELASHPEGSARNIKAGIRAKVQIDPDTWFTGPSSDALLNAKQLRD